jgi:hypothetical protein
MPTPRTLADSWSPANLDPLAKRAKSLAEYAVSSCQGTVPTDAGPAVQRLCQESECLASELQPFLAQDPQSPGNQVPEAPRRLLPALQRLHASLYPFTAKGSPFGKLSWRMQSGFSDNWPSELLRTLQPDAASLKACADDLRRVLDEAAAAPDPEATTTDSPKPSLTADQANEKAMRLAKADGSFVHKTQRQWAEALGCSTGLVSKLPFWKKAMKLSGRGRGEKKPRAVPLTDERLATAAERQAKLQKLIDEQQADDRQEEIHPRL